jgi:hypothetical protein
MLSTSRHASLTLSTLLFCSAAFAQQASPQADDSISTDRPDFVESSAVVGKGRFQVETSAAYERSSRDGVRERMSSTPTLFRYGLTDNTELRLETDGWLHAWRRGPAADDNGDVSGMADTSLGIKWHLRDGAEGVPALGVLLHADLPSGARRTGSTGVRPSLRGVAEWDLPDEFSLGVMPGLAFLRNDDGKRFTSGIFAVSLGKDFNSQWHGYVELAAPQIARGRDGGSQLSFDFGGTYLLNKQVQLDAGFARGLNRNTADLAVTFGVSFKL